MGREVVRLFWSDVERWVEEHQEVVIVVCWYDSAQREAVIIYEFKENPIHIESVSDCLINGFYEEENIFGVIGQCPFWNKEKNQCDGGIVCSNHIGSNAYKQIHGD